MALTNGQLFTSLFKNMINGCCHCQAIYNDAGQMVDWIYLLTNDAFEAKSGLHDVTGKKNSDVLPTLLQDNSELFQRYGELSRWGSGHISFEDYLKPLKTWYNVSAYSVEAGTFTVVFSNINEHKQLIATLEDAAKRIEYAYDETLAGLARALRFRDLETEEHSKRVSDLTVELARKLLISEEEVAYYRRGALLHDIGKMFVGDAILLKPGKLTFEEIELMQQHPLLAYEFLKPISFISQDMIDIPLAHHERWDGSGYPYGLSGTEIPLPARVFAVADVYDAMTSNRPYRKAFSPEFVMKYLISQVGILFDERVVDALTFIIQLSKGKRV
jgi:putative nucleotidyltransferase with HDIG domain